MKNLPIKLLLEIAILGCISGLPYSILYNTISAWLSENGYAISIITTIAIARIPYGFKYLWAPIVDTLEIPFLHKLGKRKSWMFAALFIELIVIICFYKIDAYNFTLIYILSLILGFFSATFDIAFDAYRIDNTPTENQGYAVASAVTGYRIGALIASAGGLLISNYYGWKMSFFAFFLIFLIGLVYIPLLKEIKSKAIVKKTFVEKLKSGVYEPFKDFIKKKYAFLILTAIILYKVGGVLLGFVTIPFYLELGYSKSQIASIAKLFGFFATIFGSFLGGYIVSKIGTIRALIFCGIIQAFVHGIFIWLHYADVSNYSLMIAITVENIGSALGTSAEIAYISSICNRNYSATQYALLSSLAGLMNSLISFKSGQVIEIIGWDMFFIFSIALSFPALLIFRYIDNKTK